MINSTCPYCRQETAFPEEKEGRKSPCPHCGRRMRVPQAGSRPGDVGSPGSTSLILGIVSIILPLLGAFAAVLALPYGIFGMRRRVGKGKAIAGIILGCIGLAAQAGLLYGMTRWRELESHIICATSMKGIGTSLAVYAQDNEDAYPCILGPGGSWPDRWDVDPTTGTEKEFGAWRRANAGCNIQHYWLLVRQGICEPTQFRCSSDEDWKRARNDERRGLGFDSWRNVSYAFQPAIRGGENAAWPSRASQDGATVIAGDRLTDPGAAVSGEKRRRTDTHPVDGGNYLSLDGSVEFRKDIHHTFGWQANNVYTIDVTEDGEVTSDPETGGGTFPAGDQFPEHLNDSVLLAR